MYRTQYNLSKLFIEMINYIWSEWTDPTAHTAAKTSLNLSTHQNRMKMNKSVVCGRRLFTKMFVCITRTCHTPTSHRSRFGTGKIEKYIVYVECGCPLPHCGTTAYTSEHENKLIRVFIHIIAPLCFSSGFSRHIRLQSTMNPIKWTPILAITVNGVRCYLIDS